MVDKCINCGNKREVNPNSMSVNYGWCHTCLMKRFEGVGA